MTHISQLKPLVLLSFFFLLSLFIITIKGQNNEPSHPQYHVSPPNNWMNDPNGPFYFNGIYHLFYQYNPNAPYWGDMHWGHAVSKDLVNWKNLPPALYPDQVYDKGGVFSGSVTVNELGQPIITYTGIGPVPSQCIATPLDPSDPLLVNWTKSIFNPVIPSSPPSLTLDGYRDPTTAWSDGSSYYMLVGAGISGVQGMTLLYKTEGYMNNFNNWTYVQPFYSSTNTSVSGDMWECPDFYPLGVHYVMKASTVPNLDMWFVGTYNENQTFTPFNQGVYDYGRMYASKTFEDTLNQRRILWGWVAEMDSQDSANARGWAGMQSLPRELTLTSDNKVAANPIEELSLLRTQAFNFGVVSVNNSGYTLEGITTGDQLELLINVQSIDSSVEKFGIYVRQSPDHQEQTAIYFLNAMSPTQVDMPGSDYRGISLTSADPLICQSLCFEDFACRAWTFTPAGMEGPSPMCFLKNYPATPNPKTGCVSGRKNVIVADRSNSSLSSDADKGSTTAPMNGIANTLRVFIDHSVIEIFTNDGTANIITRVYPSLSSSVGLSLFVEGEGSVELEVTAWSMGSIWN